MRAVRPTPEEGAATDGADGAGVPPAAATSSAQLGAPVSQFLTVSSRDVAAEPALNGASAKALPAPDGKGKGAEAEAEDAELPPLPWRENPLVRLQLCQLDALPTHSWGAEPPAAQQREQDVLRQAPCCFPGGRRMHPDQSPVELPSKPPALPAVHQGPLHPCTGAVRAPGVQRVGCSAAAARSRARLSHPAAPLHVPAQPHRCPTHMN